MASPEVAGAVGDGLEMAHVFDMLSDRSDLRVAVLTGAGKVFSAGADLKARPDRTKAGERRQHNRRARESYHAIRLAKRHPVFQDG